MHVSCFGFLLLFYSLFLRILLLFYSFLLISSNSKEGIEVS